MKKLIFAISIALLASCGGRDVETSGNSYDDIQISMDTVVVDSKDEILMAATSSYAQTYNSDKSRMIFWDGKSSNLEIVDLEKLELLEKKLLEKEGPNGVGKSDYQQSMLINDNLIAFFDWNLITLADFDGNVQQRIKLDEEWMKEGLDESEFLSLRGFSDDGKLMYCSITNFSKLNPNILQIDLENKDTKLIELPEFDKRENFRVTMTFEGGGISMHHPNLEMEKNYDKVIFWTNALNNIYVYDPQTDSLKFEMITNSIFPNEKMGKYNNEVSSEEAFSNEMAKINQEISFSNLFWDEKNHVYYRFAYQQLPKIADEDIKYKTFLSIIDENYQVVGEKETTDIFKSTPSAKFVKDGQIYCYLNIDDELGFVRLKIH
ncbi:DUF4221 domain-containing protein [Belliella sp. DSM 107340]|uniref:DUF4221 domain-containing protein n=1 Tax=Belliella calami TaxID=2923436 RepID=A0ABS9UNA8_9BACT|nr:DUF4221 family protein [Belliella calami]MCH7397839.1 DUF4221 domain-containing protein [Belliella calami]